MMTAAAESAAKYLYVHVPFCRTICYYCDFCHTVYREADADQWLDALEKEIRGRGISSSLLTIYIGGGTPTSLSYEQLERLLSLLDPYRMHAEEYTVEVNPETLDRGKAKLLADHGVNRVSMGFQTSDEELLKEMNRHHTSLTVKQAMVLLKEEGIDNISLDLMYSLPHQTMDSLKQSVEDALSLEPKHMSLYSLTIEENTVFGKRGYDHLDDETEADMYEMIASVLKDRGYVHYEISNYCLPGYESKHNSAYWHYEDFIGISCGASGKEGKIRYDHTRSLKEYCCSPLKRIETILEEEDLRFEYVMMGLRLRRGIEKKRFGEQFGRSFEEYYRDSLESLIRKGLMESDEEYVRCTERGFELLNSVLVELL